MRRDTPRGFRFRRASRRDRSVNGQCRTPITSTLAAATYQTGNGTRAYAWNSATTNYKRYIRFVVKAQQDAGISVMAIGRVQLIVTVLVR